MTTSATKIYGLVLAGGKSIRMGEDKGLISWHGIPQRNYTAQLLRQFCDEVFISCREEQVAEIGDTFQTITDSVDGKGPIVGILSAFKKYPDVAWLVIACDLPLIDAETIAHLIENRDENVIATTYKSPHDGLPEPLITIWEPSSVDALNSFREQGYNCPRKVLINSNAKIIEPTSSHALMNANTPEDAAAVKKDIVNSSKGALMNSAERYSCQIALPGFSPEVQQKLTDASVLIIGMGGLGCPAAQYLVAAGVGKVGIVDDDVVSLSNLHRQILYREADAGRLKVDVAQDVLTAQNPHIKIIKHQTRVHTGNIMSLLNDYDVVLDCTDNFETRYLVNDACVLAGKTLVYGAIYQYEGQVAVWNVPLSDGKSSPNYRDLYPEVNPASVPDCATGGVIPTIAGMIGCIQANEAIKYITGTGELLAGKLLTLDVKTMQSRVIKIGAVSKVSITSLPDTVNVPEITIAELEQNKEQYLLIDVRCADERATYNIGGMHIPLPEISTTEIDVTKPVVCYCASGKRSRVAAQILQQRYSGLTVFSLSGGIN